MAAVLEIVVFSGAIKQQQLKDLAPIVRLAAPALLSGEQFEQQRQTLLDSIHRMSQLYDLEKSLNATLEMDAVIAMVPAKSDRDASVPGDEFVAFRRAGTADGRKRRNR